MSMDSDTFDAEIRGPLYELKDKADILADTDHRAHFVGHMIQEAIEAADDYRIELLDDEDP